MNTTEIENIQFVLVNDETVLTDATVEIQYTEAYYDGKPKDGGPYDVHLGTNDNNVTCAVCKKTAPHCIGHFGYITLKFPIIQPLVLKDVYKWISIICSECGRCVLSQDEIVKFPPHKRFEGVWGKIKSKSNFNCHHCQAIVPKISKLKGDEESIFEMRFPGIDTPKELYAKNVATILGKISDETIRLLGRDPRQHPKDYVLNYLPIPPSTIRPDNKKLSSGQSITHNLTSMITSIMTHNKNLPDSIGQKLDIFNQQQITDKEKESIKKLTTYYYAYIKGSNDQKSLTLADLLKGKKGHFRGNQMGKRVNNTSRATVSNSIDCRVDELSVPLKFAKILQVREIVQAFNIDRLNSYVLNGTAFYPGATMIVKRSGNRKRVFYINSELSNVQKLEIGDELYRDLITGDYINFNRQPSLKETNITAMRVVVTEDPNLNTLGFNVIATKLFNADFDGDAMNAIPASSIAARTEIEMLNSAQKKMIDMNTGKPAFGQVDDSIIGMAELSRKGRTFDKFNALLMFSKTDYYPIFEENKIYTNHDIINVCFEKTPLTFENATTYYQETLAPFVEYDPDEIRLKIEKGKWISGVFDKKNIGAGAVGGLYHEIAKQYSKKNALDLIYNMQQMAITYLRLQGFTVGINDLIISEEAKRKVDEISSQIIKRSYIISDKLHRGELIPPIGKTVTEYYEELQLNELQILDDFVEVVFKGIDQKTNSLFKLFMFGSKGSPENFLNLVSSVGQKKINGERIKENYDFKRASSRSRRYETEPIARGYIPNSYKTGLTSTNYIHNAQASRFDLISKALMTSVTGHANRKSVKNLESIVIDNFRAAKKHKNIVQHLYGENGLDARYCEQVKLRLIAMSRDEINEKFYTKHNNIDEEIETLIRDRDLYRERIKRVETINIKESFKDVVTLPVNIALTRKKFVASYDSKSTKTNANKLYQKVKQFCNDLKYIFTSHEQKIKQSEVPIFYENAVFMLRIAVRTELATKVLLDEGINEDLLDIILDYIWHKVVTALIDPGTAAGILAAQAYSEPLTQYMLDAQHRSAKGGTSKSDMNKVDEIFGATEVDKVSDPSMTLFITSKDEEITEAKVQELATQIELITLKDVVSSVQVFHEKYGNPIHPDYKHEAEDIKNFNKNNPLLKVPDLAPWRIRFVISKTQLILKSLSLEYIVKKLRQTTKDIYFVYNSEQSKVIHISAFISPRSLSKDHSLNTVIQIVDELLAKNIRGIEGILTTSVKKRNVVKFIEDKPKEVEEYYIVTSGSNIVGCLTYAYETINNPNITSYVTIDPDNIQTDNITEIERMYGIEATRTKIINEMRNIIGDLFHTYYLIYADEMTFTGEYTAISKGGLTRREPNPLLGMAYEAPVGTLEKVVFNRDLVPVTGISGPLMMGTVPKIGTMFNQCIVDVDFVKKNKKSIEDVLDNL